MSSLTGVSDSLCNPPLFPTSHQSVESDGKIEISDRILQSLTSGEITKNKKQLTQDFTQIAPEQLQKVLSTYFEELTSDIQGEDHLKVVEELAEMIPFEKLEKIVCADHESALKKAKSMLENAKFYLNNIENKVSPSLRARFSAIIDSLISFIESMLSSFGIADLFKPDENKFDSERKFHKVMMLVSFFSMLTTMLLPLLGAAIGAPIIAGAFLLIGVISLIYPHIKRAPINLPSSENLTKKFHQGELKNLSLVEGREVDMNSMANQLIKNLMPGEDTKHPLLLGETGVGKSQTVEAFVQAIECGHYPELKGKKVFCINTPALFDKSDIFSGDPLKKIKEDIGRHRNNVILVFDEIHIACMEDYALLGEKLKKMLDPCGDFPLVIGITTEAEYEKYIESNDALDRRFEKIHLNNTNSDVTQTILNKAFLLQGGSPFLEKDALKMIYEKTAAKDSLQPLTSRQVLSKCIQLTSNEQTSSLNIRIEGLKDKIKFLESQGASYSASWDADDDSNQEISDLNEQIQLLKERLMDDNRQVEHLFKMRERISQVKAQTYRTVVKVAGVQASALSKSDKSQLNAFMLMAKFLTPTLEAYVRQQGKDLGLKVVIDETVINEAIQMQEGSNKKAKAESAPR